MTPGGGGLVRPLSANPGHGYNRGEPRRPVSEYGFGVPLIRISRSVDYLQT